MNEKAFVAKAKKRLEAEVGGLWITFPRTRFARSGVSDLLGCVNGRFVALEFKKPDHSNHYGVTPTQEKFLIAATENGGLALTVCCEDDLENVVWALTVGSHTQYHGAASATSASRSVTQK